MNNSLSGSCLCGNAAYRISGEVDRFYLCHCSRCRKGTGSVHASSLIYSKAQLIWLKGEALVNTFALPGSLHSRSFCSQCGAALPAFEGDLLIIPAGGIDDCIDRLPDAHIYTGDRAQWDQALDNIPGFDELPGE